MKYQNLVSRFKSVEEDILFALRSEIEDSPIMSKHIGGLTALKVNVFNYVELVIWREDMIFLDKDGHHYSLWAEATSDDLIDILNKIE